MNAAKSANAMEFREVEGETEMMLVSNLLESAFEPMKDKEAVARFITIAPDLTKLWVLDIDGAIAGTLSVKPVKNKEDIWMINNLSVAPFWRKGGLARFMIDKCIDFIKKQNGRAVIVMLHPELVAAEHLFLGELEFTPIREEGHAGVYLATVKL